MIGQTHPRHRAQARMEPLEGRRLLTGVTTTVPVHDPDCGCGSAPGTVYVDDDKQQCPHAQFTSIQVAVAYATANPTIHTVRVCPGLYNESVTVPKTLRLLGARAGQDARKRCDQTPDPKRDSIVQSVNPAGGVFSLYADDIELDGFVVRGNTAGAGIYTTPTRSGYLIENNVVTLNVFGLYFNANGLDESVARRNCFDDNTVPGAANGNGVYSDQGLRNAVITENRFEDHFNAAVVIAGAPGTQSDISITCNAAINDSTFVLLNVDSGRISNNFSYNSNGSGIFVGSSNDIDVVGNVVLRAFSSGIATNDFGAGPNTDILIARNLVAENGQYGLSLRFITNSEIVSNQALKNGTRVTNSTTEPPTSPPSTVVGGGDGIRLGDGAVNNLVWCNVADRNRRDGIRAELGSANNEIAYNRMRHNRWHDAHDDTTGPYLPAGTANNWHDNDCRTQNRPGLCDHHGGCDCRKGEDHGIPDEHDDEKAAYRASILSHEAMIDQDASVIAFDEPLVGLLPDVLPGLWN